MFRSGVDVAWAEQQHLNYLAGVLSAVNDDGEADKPRKLTGAELMAVMVD